MMRYWCVNCGEPGVCTHKTNVCGYCGYAHVREYEKDVWDATCKERSRKPRPHPPGAKGVKPVGANAPDDQSISSILGGLDYVSDTSKVETRPTGVQPIAPGTT